MLVSARRLLVAAALSLATAAPADATTRSCPAIPKKNNPSGPDTPGAKAIKATNVTCAAAKKVLTAYLNSYGSKKSGYRFTTSGSRSAARKGSAKIAFTQVGEFG